METQAEVDAYREKLLGFYDDQAVQMPRPAAGKLGMERSNVFGTPDSVVAQLQAYGDLGIGVRCVTMPGAGGRLIDLDEAKRSFRLLIDEVVPRLHFDTLPNTPHPAVA